MSDPIKDLFDAQPAPAPSADLQARILAAAPARPANDHPRWSRWVGGVAALAACAAFAAFILLPASEPTQDWERYADASGFAELYAWVEAEE